jgi:hypothetical protein
VRRWQREQDRKVQRSTTVDGKQKSGERQRDRRRQWQSSIEKREERERWREAEISR